MTESRRGLFLDLDGTIADSFAVMRDAYDRFLGAFGRCGSEEEFNSLNGPPLSEVVTRLRRAHCLIPSAADLQGVYREFIVSAYHRVGPAPGALRLIEAARDGEWKVGVVTSNSGDLALDWLRRVGLAAPMSVIVGAESVTRGKPYPDPYLEAIRQSGCDAARSVAVDDSPDGIAAAIAAGLTAFALLSDGQPAAAFPPGCQLVQGLGDVERALFDA